MAKNQQILRKADALVAQLEAIADAVENGEPAVAGDNPPTLPAASERAFATYEAGLARFMADLDYRYGPEA